MTTGNMNALRLSLCFLPLLIACSGGETGAGQDRSGVAPEKSIAELTDDEASRLCDWSLGVQGGPGSVTKCGDGSESRTHTKEVCLDALRNIGKVVATCPMNVGDGEACALESQDDPCDEKLTACDRFEKCVKDATQK